MEETKSNSTWLQDALTKGAILGIIHVFILVVIYYVMPNKLTGFSYLFAIIVINMAFIIYAGIQWRNQIGGFISYGPALLHALVIFAVNGLIGTIFTFVFLMVEPSMPEVLAQQQLDTSVYWAAKFGAPEEAIDKIKEDYNPEDVTKRYTPVGLITGFFFLCIFYVIGALIIALFVKKNPPLVF